MRVILLSYLGNLFRLAVGEQLRIVEIRDGSDDQIQVLDAVRLENITVFKVRIGLSYHDSHVAGYARALFLWCVLHTRLCTMLRKVHMRA